MCSSIWFGGGIAARAGRSLGAIDRSYKASYNKFSGNALSNSSSQENLATRWSHLNGGGETIIISTMKSEISCLPNGLAEPLGESF